MKSLSKEFDQLLQLANHYPSPHNGQPIKLKVTGDNTFELYFAKERGLSATDISYLFSFVSMGVFVSHLISAGQALGHEISFKSSLPRQAELHGNGLVSFGQGKIKWHASEPSQDVADALTFRQTSRKKYSTGIDNYSAKAVTEIANRAGMKLKSLDADKSHQAIWLNQRAVFDDMFDEPVRQELNHWLRYSAKQKQTKMDGLAYDCMEIDGRLMKFIVKHYGLLHAPVIAPILKKYYLRTMADSSSVFYMTAPFDSEQDSYSVGLCLMDIWTELSKRRLYIHPFGTIMSNHAAHQDFANLVGLKNESRKSDYLVFIFRAGKSEKPVPSMRIPYKQHLLLEEQ